MNICIIGNEDISYNWDIELENKDIIVRIFPNVFRDLYDRAYFQKEHHCILNGLYKDEDSFDLTFEQREFIQNYNIIKFMKIDRDKDLIKLDRAFGLKSFLHLARGEKFRTYIEEMESRFKNTFSSEARALLYYCFTYKEDTIHSYKFGFNSKKQTPEKKFINSLSLNLVKND